MRKLLAAMLLACAAVGFFDAGAAVAAPYSIAAPSCAINTDGWCTGGGNLTGFTSQVTNPSNFGPGGTVSTPVTINSLDEVTTASLAGHNAFISTWWSNSESASSTAAVLAFFQAGGDLVLFDDDSDHDGIAVALGLATISSDGSASNGSSPLLIGPFGTATDVNQYGNTGSLSSADVLAANGSIGATNASGEITAAYWAAGQFGAGYGKLIIIGDVDMIANSYSDPYSPLNSNGVFALNTISFLVSGNAVPEPNAWALMIVGFGLVGGLSRRTASRAAA